MRQPFTITDEDGRQFRIEPRSLDLPIYYVTDEFGTTSEFYYIETEEKWKLNRTIDALGHKISLDVPAIGELIHKHISE